MKMFTVSDLSTKLNQYTDFEIIFPGNLRNENNNISHQFNFF